MGLNQPKWMSSQTLTTGLRNVGRRKGTRASASQDFSGYFYLYFSNSLITHKENTEEINVLEIRLKTAYFCILHYSL